MEYVLLTLVAVFCIYILSTYIHIAASFYEVNKEEPPPVPSSYIALTMRSDKAKSLVWNKALAKWERRA